MIVKTLSVGMMGTNCYVVADKAGGEGMVVDPGDEPAKIIKNINDLKLTVKLIVLTHGHPDHTGALLVVRETTGAPVVVHAGDAGYLPRGVTADVLLKGGETLKIGDISFVVLHTPGHSPGGICLYGEGAVFCGDTLFNYSVGRTDFPGGSHAQLLDSIFTKLMVLPDKTIAYPGHEGQTTIGEERRYNPFLRNR